MEVTVKIKMIAKNKPILIKQKIFFLKRKKKCIEKEKIFSDILVNNKNNSKSTLNNLRKKQ